MVPDVVDNEAEHQGEGKGLNYAEYKKRRRRGEIKRKGDR